MIGTMAEDTLEMLRMPPRITRPVNTVSTTPVIQVSMAKLVWIACATELDCTELPMPNEASTPKMANSTASHFLPRPRSM